MLAGLFPSIVTSIRVAGAGRRREPAEGTRGQQPPSAARCVARASQARASCLPLPARLSRASVSPAPGEQQGQALSGETKPWAHGSVLSTCGVGEAELRGVEAQVHAMHF